MVTVVVVIGCFINSVGLNLSRPQPWQHGQAWALDGKEVSRPSTSTSVTLRGTPYRLSPPPSELVGKLQTVPALLQAPH